MTTSIVVRQAVVQDYPAIGAFIREAYGQLAPYKGYDRWSWQFLNNPAGERHGDQVPIWIAIDGTRVIGQIAVQRTSLYAAKGNYKAGWIVDVMILPPYRGKGLGNLLYHAVANSSLVLLTLTMAPATRRMAERVGAVTLAPTYQWSRFANLGTADVSRYLLSKTRHRAAWLRTATKAFSILGGATLAAVAIEAGIIMRDMFHPIPQPDPSHIFRRVEHFDERVSDVWCSLADASGSVYRTAAYLNWRFVDCPQLIYERFELERHGRIIGYLVLRRATSVELSEGYIVDAAALNNDYHIWKSLFLFGVRRFGKEVVAVVAAASTEVPSQVLKSIGFIRTRRHDPTIVCFNPQVLDELSRVGSWFFNMGDHDWDQINLA